MKKNILALLLCVLMVAAGCALADAPSAFDSCLASIVEQSEGIKDSLETEELTQMEMNEKAWALRMLWDTAAGYAMYEAMNARPEEAQALLAEQRAWLEERDEAVLAAGKDYAGGSMYQLIVDMEAARITQERVEELRELLK